METTGNPELWLAEELATIEPCAKTVAQLEEYLVEHYQAWPADLDKRQRESAKYNVLQQYFPELLPDITSGLAGMEKALKVAAALPDEALGLDFVCYQFERENGIFTVIIERKTGEAAPSFWTEDKRQTQQKQVLRIFMDILLYLGISQQDIDTKSPRFFRYLTTKQYDQEKI